jgi:hypothetical protein
MRKRGFIFLVASVPAWVYVSAFIREARKSPFGYELGSIAFPYPPRIAWSGRIALLLTLTGLLLVILDFSKWIRRRSQLS